MLNTYKLLFECPVGFSDHTNGTAVALAAVALGADIIEKHFKIDSQCNSPDAAFSIIPSKFKVMVEEIRQVKSACKTTTRVFVDQDEEKFRSRIRYKIVLRRQKYSGEAFAEGDFDFLRTSGGIDASQVELIANNFVASGDLEHNAVLQWKDLVGR